MKKLLFLLFLIPSLAFAAIDPDTAWEVRTTGNALNSGGFNSTNATPGTDYSQADAAQDTGTDLACADGDAAAPVVTSASHNFVDADEGNLIYIHEAGDGFTLGYYEIVSTAANAATLDRACGTDGAKTGGDWNLGGATDHPNTICDEVVAGNTIYIAGGTYNEVGANVYVLNTAVAGATGGAEIRWIGYKTNHSTSAFGTDRPLFDGTGVTNALVVDVALNFFYNLRFTGATGDNVILAQRSFFSNCKSSSAGDNGWESSGTVPQEFFYCEAASNTGEGFSGAWNSPIFTHCYSHDNGAEGFETSRGDNFAEVIGCIADSNSADGFTGIGFTNGGGAFLNNIAYNNTGATSDGFSFVANSNSIAGVCLNNISMNNGRYGFDAGTAGLMRQTIFDYNSYTGNGTAGVFNITAGSHDSTADPLFTAPTANPPDFTLQSTSPCKDAGFPDADWAANIGLASGRY